MPKSSKHSYHHGNLACALEEEALKIIESDGVSAVSLRELGRRLGVSRAAAYRHFEDKEALLVSIATRGLRALAQSMKSHIEQHPSANSRERLDAAGHGYVRFAQEDPAYFRLVFSKHSFVRQHAELRAAGEDSFAVLTAAVTACAEDGVLQRGDVQTATLCCWTQVHGFASLLLEGYIEGDPHERLQEVLDALFAGLAS